MDKPSFVPTLQTAISLVQSLSCSVSHSLDIFIIGGARLYTEASQIPDTRIYHTEIYEDYPNADVFWKIPNWFTPEHAENIMCATDSRDGSAICYRRYMWGRKNILSADHVLSAIPRADKCVNVDEKQYIDLLRKIYTDGVTSRDRTGTGTKSVMGGHFRFDLRTGFPAITTKPLYWKGVVEELLWLLAGDTNAKHLASVGVHIWDMDTSRSKLDERKMFHLIEGDCGATYGFNMRHYGADYRGCLENYDGLGEDQLAKCVSTLMNNPTNRRIIINLWDPSSSNNCALPPCLMMYMFYVANGELSCFTVQRSADMMLGVPFNIASASLLTHILANMTGLQLGELDHNMVNAHIYSTHMDAALEQMQREPFAKPIIKMPMDPDTGRVKKIMLSDFDPIEQSQSPFKRKYSHRDFALIGYRSHPPLKNPTIMSA